MSPKKPKDEEQTASELAPEAAEDSVPGEDEEEGDDEGLLAESSEDIDAELADEFKDYDSLEEEHIGDDTLEALAGETDEDRAAQISPKERRLADMRLEARIEAVIFASQKPLKTQEILDILADPVLTVEDVEACCELIVEFYESRHGGFKLHYLKRLGYQFQTSDAAGPIMERMFASRPRPISRAALETLAIISYRQPVTRAEVEFIRGVDAGSIFKTLLERELIKCVGRKEIVGRPMLFGTSDEFLKVFNLSSVKDLPPLESFQPSREMVKGAMDKIDGGNDLVDVEEYIADNTRGEYEGDESADDAAPQAPEEAAMRVIEGASAAPLDSTEDVIESGLAGRLAEEAYGEDSDSEMALPAGTGVPEGSGDLDR